MHSYCTIAVLNNLFDAFYIQWYVFSFFRSDSESETESDSVSNG